MDRLILALALGLVAFTPALAADPAHCLSREQQRAAITEGKAMPLARVLRALGRRPREVVRARLCQEPDRLVYRLTVLPRDGKVRREAVDAASGTVVGER